MEGEFFQRTTRNKEKVWQRLVTAHNKVLSFYRINGMTSNTAGRDYSSHSPLLLGISHITTFLTMTSDVCIKRKYSQGLSLSWFFDELENRYAYDLVPTMPRAQWHNEKAGARSQNAHVRHSTPALSNCGFITWEK